MKILAFETSCEIASVALSIDGEVFSAQLASPPAHSATLLPALRTLLVEAAVSLSDLDAVAVGVGPGSFTGVRLACSVAQGLALGADLPVIPVCSLLAMAESQAEAVKAVFCAADARMGEAYVAAYRRNGGGWQECLAPACVAPASVNVPDGEDWAGVGTAFSAYPELVQRVSSRIRILSGAAVPTATAVAHLAASIPMIDPALIAPLYVRDRVALTVAERVAAGGKA